MTKEWTPDNAAKAFTAALTRSAHDREFRERLTASPESAKKAVAEAGEIEIPERVLIVFHEKQYNEDYMVFYLPPFNEADRSQHDYQKYFQCCYQLW